MRTIPAPEAISDQMTELYYAYNMLQTALETPGNRETYAKHYALETAKAAERLARIARRIAAREVKESVRCG